jgi:hypothetical protein
LPDIVEKAVHLVAIDDFRSPFRPTLFNEDPRVTEIWCPGVHSDIGGGYYHDGLSDIALKVMKLAAEKAGMKCREITEETCKNADCCLLDPEEVPELNSGLFDDFDKDLKLEPDALESDIHNTMLGGMGYFCIVTNFFKGFEHRILSQIKNDKRDKVKPILLLDDAIKRVKEWTAEGQPDGFEAPARSYANNKYRPLALKGVPYKIVNSDDLTISEKVYDGIENEVDWEQ